MSEHGSDSADYSEAAAMDEEKSISGFMNEIHRETASELINAISHEVSPYGSSGIAALDELLVSSAGSSPTPPLNRGDVIEVQGGPGSGKTQLSYRLVMNCVLPQELVLVTKSGHIHPSTADATLKTEGWGSGAVVFDCDGRWDVARLRHMLSSWFLDIQGKNPESRLLLSIEELVNDCLKRVHVFKPYSTLSMTCTILHLPTYHAQCMANFEIALLVVDSVGAFYPQDQFFAEEQECDAEKKNVFLPLDQFLIALQDFRLTYGSVVMMTNWGLHSDANRKATWSTQKIPALTASTGTFEAPNPFYRQHLYPFPSPFDYSARVLTNAHLYPPITYHITLLLPELRQVVFEAKTVEKTDPCLPNASESTVLGIVRFVSSGTKGNFTMRIGPNGITS